MCISFWRARIRNMVSTYFSKTKHKHWPLVQSLCFYTTNFKCQFEIILKLFISFHTGQGRGQDIDVRKRRLQGGPWRHGGHRFGGKPHHDTEKATQLGADHNKVTVLHIRGWWKTGELNRSSVYICWCFCIKMLFILVIIFI